MSQYLPRLRSTLDVMPSPFPDEPGMVLRDPFGYSEDILLIPPPLLPTLACLDGKHTERDVQEMLTRLQGGEIVFTEEVRGLVSLLDTKGFLETEEFFKLRDQRHREFVAAPERLPSHAGLAYSTEPDDLRRQFDARFHEAPDGTGSEADSLLGLAAPHVSPDGGWDSYVAAYQRVGPWLGERTIVILGTSHYGEPEKFGLTKKPFLTPLGKAEVDGDLVDELARQAPDAVTIEDYCHAVEHSIEFQVLFLQYRLGAPVRILPILCGPFAESLESGKRPESDDSVRQFFEALAELAARLPERLFWVLGVDLSHVGVRYGDGIEVKAGQGPMARVAERDEGRLERICAGDVEGFFEEIQAEGDDLKWCGYSPLYTFLASLRPRWQISGRVLHYQQWNIDPQSVVSFAGVEFFGRS